MKRHEPNRHEPNCDESAAGEDNDSSGHEVSAVAEDEGRKNETKTQRTTTELH